MGIIFDILRVSKGGVERIGFTPENAPEKEFMLKIISTADPDNDIFKKNYVPPKVVQEHDLQIQNDDRFFDDLPTIDPKKRSKRTKLKFMTKARHESNIKRMKEAKKKIDVFMKDEQAFLKNFSRPKELVWADEVEHLRKKVREYELMNADSNQGKRAGGAKTPSSKTPRAGSKESQKGALGSD